MNLTIFESSMGDCLLLEAGTGELVLCDGGVKTSMETVRGELSALRDAGRELDLVYVSHVDNDHINGVLRLLEDEVEWRVFDFHQGGSPSRQPKVPRPPVIKGILHNAFRDQVRKNTRKIEDLLVASAPTLFGSAVPELIEAADAMQAIATGVPEALKVSRLVGADALDIPVNKPPGVAQGAKLLFAGRPGDEFQLGSMHFTLIGPTRDELDTLRKGWNNWLKAHADEVKAMRAQLKKRIEEFSAGTLTTSPYDLNGWNGIPSYKDVTAPNVASLMFLVEENGKTLLLTGDGQQDFILAGLQRTGHLDDGFVHLDVLKVQHHGSEHNMDEDFARKVSADHYVFCGNGSHGNPDTSVIDFVYQSRLGKPAIRALAPRAKDRDFHFWFSTTSAATTGSESHRNFKALEDHVAHLRTKSGGRLHLHFNQGASTHLAI